MATIDEIKQQAAAVKNATQVGENTAERVGGALAGLAEIVSMTSVFTAMPLVLTYSLKKAEALRPTNVIANSIIKSNGTIESFSGYSVYEFSSLKKNESLIIDIKNSRRPARP